MKLYLTIILTLILSSAAFTQQFESGKPAELKRLKRIYINALTDVKSRDIMAKEFKKAKISSLEIVDDERAAAQQRAADTGFVLAEGKNADNSRVVQNYRSAAGRRTPDKSARELAKVFIKAYKLVNAFK